MTEIFDIIIAVLIFAVVVLLISLAINYRTKSEREYDEKLKKSLEDAYIIDPETGAKLTLEQAESGHWVAHDNEFRTLPKEEIDKLPTESEQIAEIALNYLRESKSYRKTELDEEEFSVIEKTKLLNSYDDWSYSDPYRFEKGLLFLPAPEIHGYTYYQSDYKESHVMFWIKIKSVAGHYVFREKSNSEKFLDLLRNDDEFKLNNYECFTFRKSRNIILLKSIIDVFKNEKDLEIELNDKNFFIKNTKLFNLADIRKIEKIINKIEKLGMLNGW